MYDWRQMTDEQRLYTLKKRKKLNYPWHGPPHLKKDYLLFFLSAACYEHQHIIGHSTDRMVNFEKTLLETLENNCDQILAWCVLSNHYHALIKTGDVSLVLEEIGLMHGRLSYTWNGEESRRGRKCWHRCVDRAMRSHRHNLATFNYIHHNPVHHKYVTKWQEWPFSSAAEYLKRTPPQFVYQIWEEYPLLDYGKGWDDPDM